jgi:hypothetical protein
MKRSVYFMPHFDMNHFVTLDEEIISISEGGNYLSQTFDPSLQQPVKELPSRA